MGKSSRESQLISDNTNTSHLTLDSNLNINVNLDNDEAKNKATNSSFSTLNNFDIILLKVSYFKNLLTLNYFQIIHFIFADLKL
jgi:hypothetical protein